MSLRTKTNIAWLPKPNTIEFVVADTPPEREKITAALALVFDEDKLLMAHLSYDDRGWDLPGGHLDSGETTEDALIREVYEETSVVVDTPVFFGYIRIHVDIADESYPYPIPESYIALYYARHVELHPFKENDETYGRAFKTPDEVRETAWYHNHVELFEYALQKAKIRNGIFKETFLDIYDETGAALNTTASYDDVHWNGLWHKGVHLWVVRDDGHLLLHRRSLKVQTYPGLWENSASGHVDAGETSLCTARKELREEMGIDLPESEFTHIGTITDQFITNNGTCKNNEFDDIYVVFIHGEVMVDAHETEVAETTWIHFSELEKRVLEYDPEYVPRDAEYKILFPFLRKHFGI